MKTERELTELLEKLISRWEDEVVEFKEGGAGFSTHDIGKYFSALSNEANLRDASNGWLVCRKVFGSTPAQRPIFAGKAWSRDANHGCIFQLQSRRRPARRPST